MASTYILGKDEALEVSIANMQHKLNQLGIDIEQVSWLNPVPYVWSVHIHDKHCPACFTNGKGASKQAALASALGEFFERLACNYFFADYYLGEPIAHGDFVHFPSEKWFAPIDNEYPVGLLSEDLWQFYDPNTELTGDKLIDLQSSNRQRGICALPYVCQSDQQTYYFPANIIGNLYVSNGMAAGNTQYEARTQALSECIERYVKNRIISESISLPEIPPDHIATFPQIEQAIKTLEQQGFPITCFDASLGGEYPVICVTLFNPENSGCYAAFGAHPKFEVAFERTVTELLQGRSLQQLNDFPSPSFDQDEVAEQGNLETHFIDSSGLIAWDLFNETSDYPFVDWNFSGNTEQEYQYLIDLIHQQGRQIYIADYDYLSVYACRIIIPGFSEIYPVDELTWQNNNRAINLRETLSLWLAAPQDHSYCIEMLAILDELDIDEYQPIDQLIGIATDAQSPWSDLKAGEFRCILTLACGDTEEAREWANWTVLLYESSGQLTKQQQDKLRFYRAINCIISTMEQDSLAEYEQQFARLFTVEIYQLALQHVNRQAVGYQLPNISNLMNFTKQQQLMTRYQLLNNAKRAFYATPTSLS